MQRLRQASRSIQIHLRHRTIPGLKPRNIRLRNTRQRRQHPLRQMPFPTNPPQPGHAGGHAATPRILIRIQVQHVAMQRVGNPPSRTQIHVASLGRIALQRAQPRVGDTGQRFQLEQRQPATLTPFTQSHGRSHHVLISLSVRRATSLSGFNGQTNVFQSTLSVRRAT